MREIDNETRREYEQAVEVVSALVEEESRFEDFLTTERFDIHKAARRLALYWKLRVAKCSEKTGGFFLLTKAEQGH